MCARGCADLISSGGRPQCSAISVTKLHTRQSTQFRYSAVTHTNFVQPLFRLFTATVQHTHTHQSNTSMHTSWKRVRTQQRPHKQAQAHQAARRATRGGHPRSAARTTLRPKSGTHTQPNVSRRKRTPARRDAYRPWDAQQRRDAGPERDHADHDHTPLAASASPQVHLAGRSQQQEGRTRRPQVIGSAVGALHTNMDTGSRRLAGRTRPRCVPPPAHARASPPAPRLLSLRVRSRRAGPEITGRARAVRGAPGAFSRRRGSRHVLEVALLERSGDVVLIELGKRLVLLCGRVRVREARAGGEGGLACAVGRGERAHPGASAAGCGRTARGGCAPSRRPPAARCPSLGPSSEAPRR